MAGEVGWFVKGGWGAAVLKGVEIHRGLFRKSHAIEEIIQDARASQKSR